MLSIFLTILIALVNHAFHSKPIGFDPRWPDYAAPASMDVYILLSAENNSPNASWVSRVFEFSVLLTAPVQGYVSLSCLCSAIPAEGPLIAGI